VEGGKALPELWLQAVEQEDGLFPDLNAADWASLPGT